MSAKAELYETLASSSSSFCILFSVFLRLSAGLFEKQLTPANFLEWGNT